MARGGEWRRGKGEKRETPGRVEPRGERERGGRDDFTASS